MNWRNEKWEKYFALTVCPKIVCAVLLSVQLTAACLHASKRECAKDCTLTRSNISTFFSFRQFNDFASDHLLAAASTPRFNYPSQGTWPSLPDNSEAGVNFGKWSFMDHSFLVCCCWLTDWFVSTTNTNKIFLDLSTYRWRKFKWLE